MNPEDIKMTDASEIEHIEANLMGCIVNLLKQTNLIHGTICIGPCNHSLRRAAFLARHLGVCPDNLEEFTKLLEEANRAAAESAKMRDSAKKPKPSPN